MILHGGNAIEANQQLMVMFDIFKEMHPTARLQRFRGRPHNACVKRKRPEVHYTAWLQCFWGQPKDICVERKLPSKSLYGMAAILVWPTNS